MTSSLRIFSLAGLALISVVACGPDDTPTKQSAATQQDLEAYCKASCARKARCGQAPATCETDCVDSMKKAGIGKSLEAFVQAMTQCLNGLDCQKSEDSCFEAGILAVAPNYKTDPAYTHCLSVQKSCPEGNRFMDDYCTNFMVSTTAAQQAMEACYSKPCTEMKACVDSVFSGS